LNDFVLGDEIGSGGATGADFRVFKVQVDHRLILGEMRIQN
jgi:hypothetical protein